MKTKGSISLLLCMVTSAGCMNVLKLDSRMNSVGSRDSSPQYISHRAQGHVFTKRWPMATKAGAERRSFGYVTREAGSGLPPDMIEIHDNIPVADFFTKYEKMELQEAESHAAHGADEQTSEIEQLEPGLSDNMFSKIWHNYWKMYVRVFPGRTHKHTEQELKDAFAHVDAHESLAFTHDKVVGFHLDLKVAQAVSDGTALATIKSLLGPIQFLSSSLTDGLIDAQFRNSTENQTASAHNADHASVTLYNDARSLFQAFSKALKVYTRSSEVNTGLLDNDKYTDILLMKIVEVQIDFNELKNIKATLDGLNLAQNSGEENPVRKALTFMVSALDRMENVVKQIVPDFTMNALTSDLTGKALGTLVAPVAVLSKAAYFNPEKRTFAMSLEPLNINMALTESLKEITRPQLNDLIDHFGRSVDSKTLDENPAAQETKKGIFNYNYNIELGDIDGDAKDDLVLIEKEGGKIKVFTFKNESYRKNKLKFSESAEKWEDSNFLEGQGWLRGQKIRGKEVTLADLNGDGYDDIVASNEHELPLIEVNWNNSLLKFLQGIFQPISDKTPIFEKVVVRAAFRFKPEWQAGEWRSAFVQVKQDAELNEWETAFLTLDMPGLTKVDSTLFGHAEPQQGCESRIRIGNYAPDEFTDNFRHGANPIEILKDLRRRAMQRMMTYNLTNCEQTRKGLQGDFEGIDDAPSDGLLRPILSVEGSPKSSYKTYQPFDHTATHDRMTSFSDSKSITIEGGN